MLSHVRAVVPSVELDPALERTAVGPDGRLLNHQFSAVDRLNAAIARPCILASRQQQLLQTITASMAGSGVCALSALMLALAACCMAPASAVNYALPQRLPGDCVSAGVTLPATGLFPAQLIGTTPMPGSATVQVRQARLAAIVVVVGCCPCGMCQT